MIIDGTNLIVGRTATYAAKAALEGQTVAIINCEKMIITGRKKQILEGYNEKQNIGDAFKGPFYPKMPDRYVKRVIRGMLPYKQERGMKALKRVKCYIGLPAEFKTQKIETVPQADAKKLKTLKFITVNDLSKYFNKGVQWPNQH